MNKQHLESLINNAMANQVINRFTIINQNTSFKQNALIVHKRFNKAFSLLSGPNNIDTYSKDLINNFYNFINNISESDYQFYIDCIYLLTDYINICTLN